MTPKRFQLRRVKGYRKPEGGVVCTRASKWGNPFRVELGRLKDGSPLWIVQSPRGFVTSRDDVPGASALAIEYFEDALRSGDPILGFTLDDVRRELAGKPLGCFCRLDAPCHVDVLLRVANEVQS